MLTSQQSSTIEALLGHLHREHVGELISVPDRLLAQLDRQMQWRFREVFQTIVPETAAVISRYGARLVSDVPSTVKSMKNRLDEAERDEILQMCGRQLDASLYLKRLAIFASAIERKLMAFGLAFDPTVYRFDLIDALYRTDVANRTASIKAQIKTRLDVFVYADAPPPTLLPPVPSPAEDVNQALHLKPNIFGIGINLNHLVSKLLRWRNK